MRGRDRHELQWQLIRSFFRSRSSFLRLFERYERLVLSFAEEMKTDRTRLRLPADELLGLLDFKSLEALRDREILILKQTAHELFRGPDATDRFDHYVSNIYHELSILKEEHYTLKEDFVRLDRHEYNRFFREVSEFYPKRLRHVRNLYGKALRRLEEILPDLAHERIVVRSVYLFGEEAFRRDYQWGLAGLYRKMYPHGGEVEGYAVAGRSFLESGFVGEALDAFRDALLAAERRSRSKRPAVVALVAEVENEIRRLEKESA